MKRNFAQILHEVYPASQDATSLNVAILSGKQCKQAMEIAVEEALHEDRNRVQGVVNKSALQSLKYLKFLKEVYNFMKDIHLYTHVEIETMIQKIEKTVNK